ncbi:MAG TPA: 4-(cytidine 5'-diphospho)-2-C-methyl-D-erythritol kinase [Armatimonadota bacterium]|jgi:4-diphosphocytidyl-2-C-methyl-D-erythritol kinase
MIVTAPAKINLTLRILGKRPDGYHALESVMQLLSLADTLKITDAETLTFTCSDPSLANDDNLVLRAARLLQERNQIPRGAHIHLEKRIPAQAGLGGGSSDAATTLAALNEFWELRLPTDELDAYAAQLGSDVPFFLHGPSALVRGRGEEVTPVIHQTAAHVVVIKPSAGLSTPQVYANLHAPTLAPDTLPRQERPETHAMLHALASGNLDAVARALVNDLEGPALVLLPELFRLRERMLQLGCHAVLLCGSGSALFGLCHDADTARHAAVDLRNDVLWTWSGPWLLFR